ncbi:hypothetical protein NU08_4546 [Flavobacterium anhuiense]|uniref:Uncharacterized protein n=1 Tax=Flavobacterium anhuiense TaxID=459526 RepID=A0A444VS41_9FLAO|nr:hypothetical protein NU08_4546 [Flavobacterium anhuiense]
MRTVFYKFSAQRFKGLIIQRLRLFFHDKVLKNIENSRNIFWFF